MIRVVGCTGDWHLDGSRMQFLHTKECVSKMPKYLIFMGDLIDSGLDRGMQWNQETTTKQIQQLIEIVKDKVVLGYVLGNHEQRIYRLTGLNPYYTLWGDESGQLVIKNRVITFRHGTKAPQNPLIQLQDLPIIYPESNICLMGHNHHLLVSASHLGVWMCRTGTLQLYPKYADEKVLIPKPQGYIRYSIDTGKPTMEIFE